MNKAINIFMLVVLLVDAFFIGYWFGLHSHKVLVVQGSDDFLYANTFTQFQSSFAQKKEAVKEKAAERIEPVLEKRAKAKEAAQEAKKPSTDPTAQTESTIKSDAAISTDAAAGTSETTDDTSSKSEKTTSPKTTEE